MIGTQWAVARSFGAGGGTLDGVLEQIQQLAYSAAPPADGDDVALIQTSEA